MEQSILKRLFSLFDQDCIPTGIMRMTIGWLGNSSVATIPTLLDLALKGKLDGRKINDGGHIILAVVGAGINA